MITQAAFIAIIFFVGSVLVRNLTLHLIREQRAQLEKLLAQRREIQAKWETERHRNVGLDSMRVFYQRRRRDAFDDVEYMRATAQVYEQKEARLATLDEQRKRAVSELERTRRGQRDAGDESSQALANRMADDAEAKMAAVDEEIEVVSDMEVIEPERQAWDEAGALVSPIDITEEP